MENSQEILKKAYGYDEAIAEGRTLYLSPGGTGMACRFCDAMFGQGIDVETGEVILLDVQVCDCNDNNY